MNYTNLLTIRLQFIITIMYTNLLTIHLQFIITIMYTKSNNRIYNEITINKH